MLTTQKRYQNLCEELNQAVVSAALARGQVRNTVTSNDKSVTTAQWLALPGVACEDKTKRQQDVVGHSEAYHVVMRRPRGGEFDHLRDAVYGPQKF